MTIPSKWTPTDPITAERLNVSQAEASRSRRDIFLGDGSSMVNEQMGNQSANMRRPQIKLVVALEDFGIPEEPTDITGVVDDVPSGLVREVRLGRTTSTHQDDVSSVKFLAYDPISALSGSMCASSESASASSSASGPAELATKAQCDVFYVIYNVDSKRWEVIVPSESRRRVIIVGALLAPTSSVPTTGIAAGLDFDPVTKEMSANNSRYQFYNFDPDLSADDGTFAKIEYMEGIWDCYWVGCSPATGFTGLLEDPVG